MLEKLSENLYVVYVLPLKLMYHEAIYSIVTGLDVMNYRLRLFQRKP